MHKSFVSTVAVLVAVTVAGPNFDEGLLRAGSPARSSASAAAAQSKKRVTVPAGTRILIRTIDPIDTTKQKTGYRFTASLEANLQAEDVVVAPRGTTVYGRLAEASSAGRMSGSSQLTLELTDIMINDATYPVLTSEYEIKGKGEGKKTAGKILGGTGLGAGAHRRDLLREERERPLARSPALQAEQLLRLPKSASSCRYPANL